MLILLFLCPALAAAAPSRRELSAFSSCLDVAQITALTSGSGSSYTQASLAFNRRFAYSPAAIIYPTTPQQISSALACASQSSPPIPVVARSGGHSYAAYGLGGQDGALVVDLSNFKGLEVDQSTGLAVSGTGNLLGDLAQGLWDNGQRALPHGTCPYVGTGGHASFGGFGLYSRMTGLLMDRIVSADVVLANGTITTASNSTNADLFWALRGAAPSFAIVTSWTFATLVAPPVLINYDIKFSQQLTSDQTVQNLAALQTFAASPPPNELSLLCSVGVDSGVASVSFSGTYYGGLDEFNAAIQPFTAQLTGSYNLTTKQFDWYDGLVDVTGPLRTSGAEPSDNFLAKSVVTSSPLPTTSLTTWVNWMVQHGGDTDLWWWVEIDLYGGIISTILSTATAYANRNAILTWQFYGGTPNGAGDFPSNGQEFMDGLVESLVPSPTEAYPNYVDPTLGEEEWHQQYFGANFDRLVDLKRALDPGNVFRFPQSIPLST